MDLTTLLYSGLALSATGTLVYSLRTVPMAIFRRVRNRYIFSVKVYQYDNMFEVVENWLGKHHPNTYRDVEASLVVKQGEVGQESKEELVYKQEETLFLINYKGKKLFISKGKEKIDKAVSLKELYFRHFVIKGWRAKNTIDLLLKEAIELYGKDRDPDTVKIYTNNSWGDWNCTNEIPVKSFDHIILPTNQKEFLISDLEAFNGSKDWYRKRGIPFKRGYCFYGPPGNGKTTLSMSIAHRMKRSVFMLNLATIDSDSYLIRAISGLRNDSILVIEDIDKCFNQRDAVDTKVSFSTLLNCLDGALYKEGIITIITTNHIEKLDPALIRAGRIDEKMFIDNPSKELVNDYLSLFYGKEMNCELKQDISMSKVQELCMRYRNQPEKLVNPIKEEILTDD